MVVNKPTNEAIKRCECSSKIPNFHSHSSNGTKNMLYPKVLGQSGTAIPTPFVVTNPPNPMRTKVDNAVAIANRCNQMVFCASEDIK